MLSKVKKYILPWIISKSLSIVRNERCEYNYSELRKMKMSFAHLGEDMVVKFFFRERTEPGIYLDVGAHHHVMLSSTLVLYKQGWNGINIEMDRKKMGTFKKYRPDDENIIAAISAEPGEYIMYNFEFSELDCMALPGEPEPEVDGVKPIAKRTIQSKTLNDVLQDTRFHNQKIQYLNIDCEGMDLEIIKTLDLNIYEPELITVEYHDQETFDEFLEYVSQFGYEKYCIVHFTAFFHKPGNSVNDSA